MPMLSDFFKDYGSGNFYQGTAKNTSGQMYDPSAYGGAGKFDPKNPNDPNNIGPKYFTKAPSYGAWGMQTKTNGAPLNSLSYPWGTQQQGQGVQSPQSGYSYTLADLLRNYYR